MGSESDTEGHSVASVEDIPLGSATVVEVADTQIALFHLEDGFYAIDNVCTHQGGPIGKGIVEDGCVYCPWHGHQFDIRTGEHGQLERYNTQTFDVEVRDGTVFVHL